jgi:NAD(P)-dependent dehydrogenase (short-subunit alcohol dehydrogenase family)
VIIAVRGQIIFTKKSAMAGMLEGKVVLVTGAARGIGRESPLLFAREGARVVVADLSAEGVKETVKLITEAGGGATAVVTDVSKPADQAYGIAHERWSLAGFEDAA